MIDKLIFGDNQFFGVNHRSFSIAKRNSLVFSSDESIIRVLSENVDMGLKSFMFTTYDRMESIIPLMDAQGLLARLSLIPCIPYAHKYADSMADEGITKTLMKFTAGSMTSTLVNASGALLGDYSRLMRILVDMELKLYKKANVSAVFLQNIVTDLLLGLDLQDLIVEFYSYIKKKYDCQVGFITMNYPLAYKILVKELGLTDISVCTIINKIGFRMNPTKQAVEEVLSNSTIHTIAMSFLASGGILPKEACDYVKNTKGVNSYLFGASRRDHINEIYNLLL